MTSTLDRTPSPRGPWRARVHPGDGSGHEPADLDHRGPWWQPRPSRLIALIVVVATCFRLPLLHRPPSPDEAGFLLVGSQWHQFGTSLYGDYWVDRPPLLISLFQLASDTGGLVALRVLGCLAAALVIVGAATVARRLGGNRAGVWAALFAAAWTVTPLNGSLSVNGELLAAPFVIWGIAAAIEACTSPSGARRRLMAAASGAALVASVMVKQNMMDVGVFVVAASVLLLRSGDLRGARLRTLATAFFAGVAAAGTLIAVWTVAHGTSLVGVFDAMYPFRLAATKVMASTANIHASKRLSAMVASWLLSAGLLAMVAVGFALVRRRVRGPFVWALVVTSAYEVVSVLAGGNYWGHYLVQLVGPLSVLAGLAAARASVGVRPLAVVAVLSALFAWVVALPYQTTSLAADVGQAVGTAAEPTDTIVTLYGHADVVQASGLSSPYPYLWSLPLKTKDPRLQQLDTVLAGPEAPTWFVVWSGLRTWGVHTGPTAHLLAKRYHAVAHLAGRTVYLRDDVVRPSPVLAEPRPRTPHLITTSLKELLS